MFRNVSSEQSAPAHAVSSPVLVTQESSWISVPAVLSRVAMFMQKYLPGRNQSPETRAGCFSRDFKHHFVDEESVFLRQLDEMMTQYPVSCERCDRDGILLPSSRLTMDSLRQLGIQDSDEADMNLYQPSHSGYFSTARTFLSQVLMSSGSSSSQEQRHPDRGQEWVRSPAQSRGKSHRWWSSFWGSDESSLWSNAPWVEEGTLTCQFCPQHPVAGTKVPAVKTSKVIVYSRNRVWMLGETTGQRDPKDQPANNENFQTAPAEGSTADYINTTSSIITGAAACSEGTLRTPDQDNGYSSLEEEHSHISHVNVMKAACEDQPPQLIESKESSTAANCEPDGEMSEVGETEEEERDDYSGCSGSKDEEEETVSQEGLSAAAPVLSSPQCQNKTIAYIMGCPCSDDDDSQSDRESSDDDDDDDDDGFDSEGLSDSADEDDDEASDSDSDSEADLETEHLWTFLCQSQDPYNPQNFTARLHTGSTTEPRTIPATLTSASSTPDSSPDLTPLPLSSLQVSPPLTSSCPPQSQDSWDDSTSASEVDEAEGLRLWRSFSSSSDPYSPFNFQASLCSRGPVEQGSRATSRSRKVSGVPPHSLQQNSASSTPQYRKEEAEERLDSGFSDPLASLVSSSALSYGVTAKKVRFCEDVEEFFASCGEEEEDRRGPWEELARDRCRFLRRCQEVEQSIAYCLQPRHRGLVYQRLIVFYGQDRERPPTPT